MCARAIEEPTLYGRQSFTLGIGEFSPQRNVLVPGLDLVPATDSLFDADKVLSKEYDNCVAVALAARARFPGAAYFAAGLSAFTRM